MEKRLSLKTLLTILVIIYFLAPFWILIFYAKSFKPLSYHEVSEALSFTTLQASLSAIISLTIGLLGAMGLLSLSKRHILIRASLDLLVILPNFLPPLFIILAYLNLFSGFPYGLTGIVILHVVINSGIVAFTIRALFLEKIGRMAELAWIEGASKIKFLYQCIKYLRKDFAILFLSIFTISFTSFAIPLIIGRGNQTLELLIYEKIRISQDYGAALTLSAMQSVFLFILSIGLLDRSQTQLSDQQMETQLLQAPWGLIPVVVISILGILGQLKEIPSGYQQLMMQDSLRAQIPHAIWGTLSIALLTGMGTMKLLLLTAYISPNKFLRRFLMSYIAPSSALTGLAILLIPLKISPHFLTAVTYLKATVGLSLVFFGVLYRISWGSHLSALEGQLAVADLLGASRYEQFKKIIFPQVFKTAGWLSGIAAFWAAGEFALVKMLSESDLTLSLIVQNLLGSYRFELANVLSFLLLLLGLGVFILFWSVPYVFNKKSNA